MNYKPDIGAVVRLNSGGPDLVVTHHGSNSGVFVSWMNQNDEEQSTSFPMECLTLVSKHES